MNLGNTTFTVYWIMLIVSGVLLLVTAGTNFGGQTTGARVVAGLFGLGFLGYGLYLGFIFTGTEYRIFFYAFVVPILVIVNAVKSNNARKAQANQPPAPWQQPAGAPAADSPHMAYLQGGAPQPGIAQPGVPAQPQGPTVQSPIQPG